jgi:2-methylaconitate cis-trans-isomerase PrpF
MSEVTSMQRIPCVLMRGGTSRGPYFNAADLPADQSAVAEVLIEAMGAGHELQITGIGGGNPLTSKVAIVGASALPDADVDYLFAQVMVRERRVDFSPNCGNMLAGVGPFAIESQMIAARDGVTPVRIRNVNTGKLIEARVQTPNCKVQYDGEAVIDGVPGSGAPIHLAFLDAAGSKTGAFLPTGSPVDMIEGLRVSCVDAAMPVMLIHANDLGVSGYETAAELNANSELRKRLQRLRLVAGEIMGLHDVANSVIPKPVLIAPPVNGGAITARYFMPHECHTSLSVTGGIAIASASVAPGTIAAEIARAPALHGDIRIEHPSGHIDIRVETQSDGRPPIAMVTRTARPIMQGMLMLNMPCGGRV